MKKTFAIASAAVVVALGGSIASNAATKKLQVKTALCTQTVSCPNTGSTACGVTVTNCAIAVNKP